MKSQPAPLGTLFADAHRYHRSGRLQEAERLYRQILRIAPRHAETLHLLGVLAHQVGRHEIAVDLIARAIAEDDRVPSYHCNFANALQAHGKRDQAVMSYERALALKEDYAEAHYNLGVALEDQGKRNEAENSYRRAIFHAPDLAAAHYNLGNLLQARGEVDAAAESFRMALRCKDDYPQAHGNLGNVLKAQGQLDAAIRSYRHALAIDPGGEPEMLSNLGIILQEQGNLADATVCYQRALALRPDYAEVHFNLGKVHGDQGRLTLAVRTYRLALVLKPDLIGVYNSLGCVLANQASARDAIACFSKVLVLDPGFPEASSNFLLALNYDARMPTRAVFAAHRHWGSRFDGMAPNFHGNDRDPERRLQVGYVSPDFRRHSVAYFLEPLLRAHDRNAVEISCYAEVARPDSVTARFEAIADRWHSTVDISDASLIRQIRDDGIDILVDLAGHTANNRLSIFAAKPAPIQVAWLGYPNTTGLAAIDCRFVDAVTDPVGTADGTASETLLRLDGGFLCYGPPADAPMPAPPPAAANGFVTFGSFNNPAKLTDSTLDAWAALLTRVAGAQLLLKALPFADAGTRSLFLAKMTVRGVDTDRLILLDHRADPADHLGLYGRVDIALDPFHYNGTTTTCEALWMGVPVVTLLGDQHAGRVGASLLGILGLDELIARDAEDYLQIAAGLAADLGRLATLRADLRARMSSSLLCDAATFAHKIEATYRSLWRSWCQTLPNDRSLLR